MGLKPELPCRLARRLSKVVRLHIEPQQVAQHAGNSRHRCHQVLGYPHLDPAFSSPSFRCTSIASVAAQASRLLWIKAPFASRSCTALCPAWSQPPCRRTPVPVSGGLRGRVLGRVYTGPQAVGVLPWSSGSMLSSALAFPQWGLQEPLRPRPFICSCCCCLFAQETLCSQAYL